MFLNVKNISKKFNDNLVLDDVSFGIEKSEIVAIIGQSGAGKTTLLRCLNFLEKADSGSIEIGGKVIYDVKQDNSLSEKEIAKKRKHFGLVFQSFNLFPQYTVEENITLASKILKKDTRETNEKCLKLLEELGLKDKKDCYPHTLSGGQQQRVAIARALALSPDVLCFDEPTSALDPALVGGVIDVIKKLKQAGACIMIVTHDMSFASKVADRIMFIVDGKVEECSDTDEFFNSPKSTKTKEFISNLGLY